MRRILITTLLAGMAVLATNAQAHGVNVGVSVGGVIQPGLYGQVNISNGWPVVAYAPPPVPVAYYAPAPRYIRYVRDEPRCERPYEYGRWEGRHYRHEWREHGRGRGRDWDD